MRKPSSSGRGGERLRAGLGAASGAASSGSGVAYATRLVRLWGLRPALGRELPRGLCAQRRSNAKSQYDSAVAASAIMPNHARKTWSCVATAPAPKPKQCRICSPP